MNRSAPTFRPGIAGLIPEAWIVKPTSDRGLPPVVAIHGITRSVKETVELLAPRAEATGRTIVVPHFDRVGWPRYQLAACKSRADWALLRLMEALRADGEVGNGRFDLSGFSGGAQFAHRFTWLYPEMVGRLCATAPGWWTFPDPEAAWPYGMGVSGTSASDLGRDAKSVGLQSFRLRANLRRFLDRSVVICVGSDDIERDHNLRQGPAIDAQQGTTRMERARRWCEAAEATARAHGLEPAITLKVLQGCGHSFAECVAHGDLDSYFVPAAARCAGCLCEATGPIAPSYTLTERTAA